ncbi:hypothetical protein D0868_10197 [Hortaea werneckii]|uniref:Clock-controlled protein 6 n=1 Tax=Hortaea werneckii TaxID=91943 RepID=A0A3M6Y673_HORWE|nr:hypothetical protein D0868_10197 [Hortaea werneckii]RMY31984.1 hypothetical protein D0866_06924 [Hortaea werneckii]
MRFTAAIAAAGLAGAAVADHMGNSTMAASASDVYVTDVVTAYTTYCPNPTKITHKGETYTVSEATTLTITNCPGGCTVTKPASSAVVSVCSTCSSAPVVPETTAPAVETTPVAMPKPSAGAPYPSANGTTTAPYGSGAPAGTGSSATGSSTSPAYTGAANQAYLSASAGFLALFGLVAAL